jgi:hypothetical protein
VVAAHEHPKEYPPWQSPVPVALLCPFRPGDATFTFTCAKHAAPILGRVGRKRANSREIARAHQ